MNKNKAGFTLVELLVVIAIIGILSTVAVVNLNTARTKSRLATAQSSLASVMTAVVDCVDSGIPLNSNGGHCEPWLTSVSAGVPICAGSTVTWPTLPSGFADIYCFNFGGTLLYGAQYQPPSGPSITCRQVSGCLLP